LVHDKKMIHKESIDDNFVNRCVGEVRS